MKEPWTHKPVILMVDDTPTNLGVLSEFLSLDGYEVLVAEDGESALERASYAKPDLILLDVLMPEMDGFETCRRLKAQPDTQNIPIIFMTALSDTDHKIQGFEVGAVDYITKPFQQEEVRARVSTHLHLLHIQRQLQDQNRELQEEIQAHTRTQATVAYLDDQIKSLTDSGTIIGESPVLKNVFEQVAQVAATDATVLILGETGTGKELLARALHDQSGRREKPLIIVNCAAIPKELVESEFFGHEKGSFTGAFAKRIGRFEMANKGTLFLDEVGELSLDVQSKLLRVLQQQEFERVGGTETFKVDVRVIAATNRNLAQEVAEKRFREDLFYRLNVFPLINPPLRERPDDIRMLVSHFLKRFSKKHGKNLQLPAQATLARLMNYSWPGNIRELENTIERAAILCQNKTLEVPEHLITSAAIPTARHDSSESTDSRSLQTLEEIERDHILNVLENTNWRVSGDGGAAEILGLNRSTLEARMKKLGISRKS